MKSALRVSIFALLAALMLLLWQPSAPVTAQTADPKAAGDSKDPSQKKISLDKFKMPPGGVVILVDEIKDPRSFFPRMVIYSPEEHQKLMDRLSLLEKQVKSDRKIPYSCMLSAILEGDVVRVAADLHFQADQPHSTVLAGFRNTQLNEAKIRPTGSKNDWQPAVVDLGADGYVVQVDKAGDYELRIGVRLPLTSSSPGTQAPGMERSFDLALPGAAVTTLTLELPEAVKELRWNKTNVEKPLPPATELKHWEAAIGKVTQLQVSWKEALAPGGTTPLQTVNGKIAVRVEEAQVLTTAELTLTDLRGKTKEWRMWLPPLAKVKVMTPVGLAHQWNQIEPYQHILQLTTATTDPIKVAVTLAAPRAGNAKISVGPFSVQDAVRQEGTIEVKLPLEARGGLRLIYRGNLDALPPPRDQPGNEVVAAFKYSNMPTPESGAAPNLAAKVLVAPLEIEPQMIQGKVETHVEHNLQLQQSPLGWQIAAKCKIVARPLDLDAPVTYLDVQLPRLPMGILALLMEPTSPGLSGWTLANQFPVCSEWVLASPVTSVELQFADVAAKIQGKARIKCSQAQSKEFTITLEAKFTLPPGMQKVRLELPRPLAILDRGAKGQMEVGAALELLTQDGGPELPVPQKHQQAETWPRAPAIWNLAWRTHQPEFPVMSTADVTFWHQHAHVQQQFSWDQADRPRGSAGQPVLLRLRVPSETKRLKVVNGGKLESNGLDKNLVWIEVPDKAGKSAMTLEYDFGLPAPANAATPFSIPLLWLDQATHVDTKVRLWSQPDFQPFISEALLAELVWKDLGGEIVAGRDSLPARVLLAEGQHAPLVVRLEKAAAPLASVVMDRVLMLVAVDDDGTERYHARFLLAKLQASHLDVRMPLPLANLGPDAFVLDGKQVHWQPQGSSGLVARLNIDPSLYDRPVVLAINYQLPRAQPRQEGWSQTTLDPPFVEGSVLLGKVRWQVLLPPSMLAVAARGEATTEHSMVWRSWLPSLEPVISESDLEHWPFGSDQAGLWKDANLVSHANSLEPLRIFRVARAMWFLICSGSVLLLGLVLWRFPPSAAGGTAVVVVVLGGLIGVGWLWPALLPALVYGAAPALVVLSVLMMIQWLVHERYRRQLVFMPGFTRIKAGSSLIKTGGIQRSHEPSTIDAPLPLEKSLPGLKPKI